MSRVLDDFGSPAEAPGSEDVLQSGQRKSNNFLGSVDDCLEAFSVCLCAVSIPRLTFTKLPNLCLLDSLGKPILLQLQKSDVDLQAQGK